MHKKAFFQSNGRRFLVIVIATFVLYQISLGLLTPPIAWVFVSLAAGALACCIWIKKEWVSYAAITLVGLFAVGAGTEFYFYSKQNAVFGDITTAGDMKSSWQQRLPDLGYAPMPKATQTRGILKRGDRLIYDVLYTSNDDGWRITPVHKDASKAVVFFGCSFTAGQGVNDQETYPYMVGEMLGPDVQALNYAFHGYGAHQFLAFLESGRLDAILKKYEHVDIFFLNIAGHELRSAGFSPWDRFGPRYVLQQDKAVRQGNFASVKNPSIKNDLTAFLREEVRKTLYKSFLFRKIFDSPREKDRPQMLALQRAILVRAGEVLKEKKSNASYTVLTYPDAQYNAAYLQGAGLAVLDTTTFFPDSPENPKYIIREDGHPSPLAYRQMAEGLIPFILKGSIPPAPPAHAGTLPDPLPPLPGSQVPAW